MRKVAMVSLLCLCGCSEGGTSLEQPEPGGCPAGKKDCGGTCVSVLDPATGCGEPTCDPCLTRTEQTAICVEGACADGPCNEGYDDCDALAANGCETELSTDEASCGSCGIACNDAHGGTVTCHDGTCKVDSCAGTWADCNGKGDDGCEANLKNDPEDCSACGAACDSEEQCYDGACVKSSAVLGWLDEHKGGWCLDDYAKLVNLCGKVSYCEWELCGDLDEFKKDEHPETCYPDYEHEHERAVPFCCDPAFFKAYPDGIAIDIGFYYDGVSTGSVVGLGGDADNDQVSLAFASQGLLRAFFPPDITDLTHPVGAGPHLASFYLGAAKIRYYVDGILVGEAGGLAKPLELVATAGPGFTLGNRISYWWQPENASLRFAPFFVHLRNGDEDPTTWSLSRATQAGPRTIVLFDETGVSGNTWQSNVGGKTGFAVNKSEDGPEPTWTADVAMDCF